MAMVTESKSVDTVNFMDYDAIFLPGGHGTVSNSGSELCKVVYGALVCCSARAQLRCWVVRSICCTASLVLVCVTMMPGRVMNRMHVPVNLP